MKENIIKKVKKALLNDFLKKLKDLLSKAKTSLTKTSAFKKISLTIEKVIFPNIEKARIFLKVRFKEDLEKLSTITKAPDKISIITIEKERLNIANLDLENKKTIASFYAIRLTDDKDESLIISLKNLYNKLNKNIILNLSSSEVEYKILDIPLMPDSEIPEAIKWKIKDFLTYDISKSLFSYQIAQEKTDIDSAKLLEVAVVVAQKDLVERYVSILRQANLNILNISASAISISNLIGHGKQYLKKTICVTEINEDAAFIHIYKNAKLAFTRKINIGSHSITEALTGVVVFYQDKIQLSTLEAFDLQDQVGIPFEQEGMYKDKISYSQINAMIRPLLERLAREMKRSEQYYVSELKGNEVETFFITGTGSRLKNLDRYLTIELEKSTQLLDIDEDLEVHDRNGFLDHRPECLMCVGAGISMGSDFNLMPADLENADFKEFEKLSLRLFIVISICVFFILFIITSTKINHYNKRKKNSTSQMNLMTQIRQEHNKMIEIENFINKNKYNVIPAEYILKELSNIMPNQVLLSSLTLDHSNRNVILVGNLSTSTSTEILAEFLKKAKSSLLFKSAEIRSYKKNQEQSKVSLDFVIELLINE